MAVDQEKVPEFMGTVSAGAIVRGVESGYYFNLTWLFDEYPTFTVRQAILRRWLDRPIQAYDYQADWIEARIRDLNKEETETHSGFWKQLLDWYVFNAEGELINRALDFAVGITKMDYFGTLRGFFYLSDVLKIIAGRLDRSPEIYQDIKTPALKLFLESFLVQAYQPNSTIYDFTMVDIKRVVTCAISVEDWQFLPLIEQVLYKLSNQRRPERYDFKQEVEILRNITFLKEAVRFFREKTEEVKNA